MQVLHYSVRCCLIVTLALLGACSGLKLAYNNTDFLLLRYADSYLDLSSKQKEFLRARLSERLEAHRQDELPRARALLLSLRSEVADGLNSGEVDELLSHMEANFQTTIAKTLPLFTPVLADLSGPGEQIMHLRRKMVGENEEYKEEFLQEDLGGRLEARTQRFTKRVENWTGRLTQNQRRLIARVVGLWPNTTPNCFDYRLAR